MLKKRIIPCLDIQDGRTVKGVQFVGLRDAGDPVSLAAQYMEQGADELVLLDITATVEGRGTLLALVARVAREVRIPFTVGGGIRTVEEARAVIRAGADKVSVNSAAVQRPALVHELSEELGSQCVVVAIDTRSTGPGRHEVHVSGGRKATGRPTLEWAQEATALGAGELLLTCMDADGRQQGFDLAVTQAVSAAVRVPVIASGGAGTVAHFHDLFTLTQASAGLAASIFHYGTLPLTQLKPALRQLQIPIR